LSLFLCFSGRHFYFVFVCVALEKSDFWQNAKVLKKFLLPVFSVQGPLLLCILKLRSTELSVPIHI
jgi:hypothetical protein